MKTTVHTVSYKIFRKERVNMKNMQKSTKNLLNFALALVLGLIAMALMGSTELTVQGQRMVGVLVAIMYIWISGCMPLAASCLVLIILETFAATDFTGAIEGGLTMSKALSKTLASFASTTPMTVIVGTALAAVVKSSGLAERIVYLIMRLVAGKSGKAKASRVLGAMFLADVPASLMIPSATGRCALYMSIAEGFEGPFKFGDPEKEHNPFQKAVWIAVALIPIIMGGAFLTGAEATIMVGGLIEETSGVAQGWGITFAVLWIPALLLMAAAFIILMKRYPSNVGDVDVSFINNKLASMGKMTRNEIYCLVVLVMMVLLFVTDSIHGIPATFVLVIMCALLFLPGIGPGNWKVDGKKISWDGYFIIASAMGFSSLLSSFGVMKFFADKIALLGIHSYLVALLVMIVVTLLVRLGIASITSAATLLVPISMAVGSAAGLNPAQIACLAWITYVFCRISFFLPHQGAQLIMTYGVGFYTKEDLMKSACVITAAAVVIYFIWGGFIAPLIYSIA